MVTAYREWQEAFDDDATRPTPTRDAAKTKRGQQAATALRIGDRATATARRLNVEVQDAEAEATQRDQQMRLEAIARFEMRRTELVGRLDLGAQRIEEARAEGKEVTQWENHWITLLHQYEQTCDRIRELQSEL